MLSGMLYHLYLENQINKKSVGNYHLSSNENNNIEVIKH